MKKNQLIQEIDLGKDVFSHDYGETIFLIGRSKDCHIVLDDKKISREHARIIHKNGNWSIQKTAVENICKINDDDFEIHELEDGDTFSAENFSIVFSNSTTAAVEEKKVSKEVEPLDKDATGEIEISEPEKKEETIEEIPTVEEVEYQETPEDDILVSNDLPLSSQETDAGIAVLEDPNTSYSLENIDSENSEEDEKTKVMESFSTISLELFGQTAPYDRYLIVDEKTTIGRDPSKCQIVLNDSEVSTVHAVLIKNNIMITLQDLNSSNGTLYKGERINKAILGHNDEFVIGGVTFTLKIRSEFLKEQSSTLMAVDENQVVEVEEIVEVETEEGEQLDALGEMVTNEPEEKSIIKKIWKDEAKRKKLIYGVVALVAFYVFFADEEKPKAPVAKNPKAKIVKKEINTKNSLKMLSEEQKRSFSATYEIGKEHYQNGRYREALNELQKIALVDPNFNSNLQSLIALSKEGLGKIEEEERKRQDEIQSAERKIKVKELLENARDYTKDRRVDLATKIFNEIMQLEPENLEVARMKMELDDWQREKQRKELEEATKKKEREDRVEKLRPGRTLYLQKEWFRSINKLEDFLRIKEMDDDLTTEASEMLKVSREELGAAVSPLIGKAKSLLEGQDLKGAYEVYQQILRIEPSNTEALNQLGDIKEQLSNRARKIYREGIIAESLSLFQDAKEKFQEVQQVSPVDSDYYKKASEKLKDYLE